MGNESLLSGVYPWSRNIHFFIHGKLAKNMAKWLMKIWYISMMKSKKRKEKKERRKKEEKWIKPLNQSLSFSLSLEATAVWDNCAKRLSKRDALEELQESCKQLVILSWIFGWFMRHLCKKVARSSISLGILVALVDDTWTSVPAETNSKYSSSISVPSSRVTLSFSSFWNSIAVRYKLQLQYYVEQ